MYLTILLGIPSELTIDNLKTEMKVTDEQLNTAIKEPDLPELAACFDNVHNGYLEKLELLPGEQTDVRTRAYVDGTLAGMLLALKCWILTKGLEATFRALLLISLSLLKENVAVRVCKYLFDKCESELLCESMVIVIHSGVLRHVQN